MKGKEEVKGEEEGEGAGGGTEKKYKAEQEKEHKKEQDTEQNKDHQRMMVDPMFMIVQSLRSFLTAVKTTALAPIAVILPKFYLI